MRKRIITPTSETIRDRGERWLDIARAALVEITSEKPDYPIESAFKTGETRGWRAATAGSQTIRLIFDQPQRIKCISLVFEESETPGSSRLAQKFASVLTAIEVGLQRFGGELRRDIPGAVAINLE